MKIFITGATGFIGRALVLRLRRDGHEIIAWVRSVEKAKAQLGSEVQLLQVDEDEATAVTKLKGVDAVVNLAGENLFGKRWSKEVKRNLVESRVGVTQALIDLIQGLDQRPRVFISTSAVGFYGTQSDDALTEDSGPGHDFLADLCQRWEASESQAADLGMRVAVLRLGTVLGPEGGALLKLAPLFRLCLGATLGSGAQNLSWIHLEDLVEMIVQALSDHRFQGTINATSPMPVTNREFTAALARALKRPAFLLIPGIVLRLLFGEAATVLLANQRVRPKKLEELGFLFRFSTIEGALEDLLGQHYHPEITDIRQVPLEIDSSIRPSYLLEQSIILEAPLNQVFDFFSQAKNLGLLTPSWMHFQIQGENPHPLYEGAEIVYRIKLGAFPVKWKTRIVIWETGRRFVDLQEQGPYRYWRHEHLFFDLGEKTKVEDRVLYMLPLGIIGRLVHRLMVASQLRRIFAFRRFSMRLRFRISHL